MGAREREREREKEDMIIGDAFDLEFHSKYQGLSFLSLYFSFRFGAAQ